MPSLTLKPGREKSLLRHHPWVFSGAIDRLDGSPVSGDTVDVLSSRGEFLARAAFSPCSQIRARVWTFADEPVDNAFLRGRILTAIRSRSSIPLPHDTGAFRLIHAESDGLPGLIVDRYAGTLVVQFLSAGAEFWKPAIASILLDITGLKQAQEVAAREQERFRLIFESVPVGITWQMPGREDETRIANPAHVQITGVPAEQCHDPEAYLRVTHPDDAGPQRALGVVAVRDGRAENRHGRQPGGSRPKDAVRGRACAASAGCAPARQCPSLAASGLYG